MRTSNERNVGRIVDLLIDPNGAVEAAVVEFGGFLGIGTRKIAIEWSALGFRDPRTSWSPSWTFPAISFASRPNTSRANLQQS